MHCFLPPFLYNENRIPSDHSHGIFYCFHIFTINWCIFCFSVRLPFFITSGNITSGPAALLGFISLIISLFLHMLAPLVLGYLLDPHLFLYYLFFQSQDLVVPWSIVTIFPVFVFFLIVCCRLYPYMPMSLQWINEINFEHLYRIFLYPFSYLYHLFL